MIWTVFWLLKFPHELADSLILLAFGKERRKRQRDFKEAKARERMEKAMVCSRFLLLIRTDSLIAHSVMHTRL